MNTSRMQHLAPALMVFVLAATVTWLSFTQEPAAAFLFPRAISVTFIVLASWNLFRAATGQSRVGSGISWKMARNILPGLVVMLALFFWAAKALGFYTSSAIAFMLIYSLYDPARLDSGKDWIKRVITTALFIAVMYGLFALILQVQTPRGMFL